MNRNRTQQNLTQEELDYNMISLMNLECALNDKSKCRFSGICMGEICGECAP